MPRQFQYQPFKRTGITFTLIGKPYLYLAYCLTLGAFHPLYWKINVHGLPTYRYRSKATNYLPSAAHVATSANWASQAPMIFFYRHYNGVRNITGTLVKITNYAKGVIEQAGRHFEKTS